MSSSIEILADGPFPLDAIDILWQDRAPLTDARAAAHIAARWQIYQAEAQARGAHLFDAPAAHLLAWSVAAGRLRLTLTPTDYQTFLVTTLRDRAWFETHAPQAITPVLGNSALLTYRHHALLGVRSAKVAAYPRRAHLFGGVFDILSPAGAHNAASLQQHLMRELSEELGLTPTQLARPPMVLALVRDPFLAQPELIWHVELAEELETLLNRPSDDEHDRLRLLDMHALPATTDDITPAARAAMHRWKTFAKIYN